MDLYELLGVRCAATPAELRRGYQRLARQLHPAVNPADPVSAERFRAVSEAYQVLSDPERRARYDRGEPVAAAPAKEPQVGFEGFDFSVETRRVGVGFREIFDSVLPGAAGGLEPTPGEDLEQATRVAFEESFKGTRRRVHLVRMDACPICRGSGLTSLSPVACDRCQGSGQLRARRGHMVFSRSCSECGGRGFLSRPCARCDGEGRLMQGEWLEVELPPGVRSGSRVSVPGAGNAGRRGGPAGDLRLVVEVEPHPLFRREEDDLFCEVRVSLAEAALGGHVSVPTPDEPVNIEIPAGTQTGQRFRLRKRGMPKPGDQGRGDLWVEARVVVPAVTDARGRELLRELERLYPANPRQAAGKGAGRPAKE
jgi:molecular chaperone DnaJ